MTVWNVVMSPLTQLTNWGNLFRRSGLAATYKCLCTMRQRLAMSGIEMHSVVALVQDLPEEGLVRGQVGTVVETWAPGVYEVEFCDDQGRTYAMVALKGEQLMRLHYEPVHQIPPTPTRSLHAARPSARH